MFNWASFLTYAVITAATPGPNNIMSMSNAARLGLKKSFPFNLGIWTGFSIVMCICTAVSSLLNSILPMMVRPMTFFGAAYMLYLAWQTLRSPTEIQERNSRSGFLSGLLLQFINPKIYIYCILSMEAFILPIYHGNFLALFAFAMLLAFIGFSFTLCWALFGSAFRTLFASKHAKTVNALLALLLVYCAVSLFF